MKGKAALFIGIMLVFCLAACGAGNNGGNQNNAENAPAVSSEPSVENIPVEGMEEALGQRGAETAEDLAGAKTDTTGSNIGINAKAALLEEGDGNTVLSATADPHNSQTLYLWEEGNAPAVTEYTVNNGSYADAVETAGVRVERLQLDGRPHGFGYREDWFDAYDSFLTEVFSEA